MDDYPKSKTKPWPHQKEVWRLAQKLEAFMIAHDMGAGKSKTAIDFCTGIATGNDKVAVDYCTGVNAFRVLILCPKSVIAVWPRQFAMHAGVDYRVVALVKGTTEDKAALMQRTLEVYGKERLVFVVNYESAIRPPLGPEYHPRTSRIVAPGALYKQEWDVMIVDESHRIKAPGGKASWLCAKLRPRAKRRLCLTGTPMPHSPLDIYAQYRFLDPNVLDPSFTRFRARYAIMGGFQGKQVVNFRGLNDLQRRVYSIAHRVTKDEVLELPEMMHEDRPFTLSPKADRLYHELENEFYAQVEAGEVTIANALVKLLRLQQITSGFVKADDGTLIKVDDGKREMLADILEDIGPEEPVVVFCNFHSDLDAVRDAAHKVGRSSCELSGRVNELEEWQMGEHNVIAVQVKAGGLGVDFTRSCYVIYYSLGFSLGDYEQSLARAHRPGQTRKVLVYHLVAENTIDVTVYQALRRKKNVIEAVLTRRTVEEAA